MGFRNYEYYNIPTIRLTLVFFYGKLHNRHCNNNLFYRVSAFLQLQARSWRDRGEGLNRVIKIDFSGLETRESVWVETLEVCVSYSLLAPCIRFVPTPALSPPSAAPVTPAISSSQKTGEAEACPATGPRPATGVEHSDISAEKLSVPARYGEASPDKTGRPMPGCPPARP